MTKHDLLRGLESGFLRKWIYDVLFCFFGCCSLFVYERWDLNSYLCDGWAAMSFTEQNASDLIWR